MFIRWPLAFLISICLSCNSSPSPKELAHLNDSTVYGPSDSFPEVESGLEKNNDPIRAHGEAILAGKVEPMDDDLTVACLDSLFSDDPDSRLFYFSVLKVIGNKADAALSEILSYRVTQVFSKMPLAFIGFYEQLDAEEKQNFSDFIAYQFNDVDNYKKAVDQYFKKIDSSCKACSGETEVRESIASLKKAVLKRIEEEQSTAAE